MIRSVGYALIVALVFMSCSSKKQATYERTKKVAKIQPSQNPNAAIAKGAQENSQFYSLPEDPGGFVKFPIASTEEYIATFAEIAQFEMRAYGIPASITLAQGILESGAGRGALTLRTNNHFGIKCHTGWGGDFDFHDDDTRGECFRKYNHPLYSFRDHSLFLSSRSHYAFLFDYRKDDYKKWAHGLQKAGYATDRKYPQKLITLIERYNLDRYDREVLYAGLDTKSLSESEVDTRLAHIVKKGDTLYAISKRYDIPVKELMQLNKLNSPHLSIGQVLKIQKEKSK